MIAFSIMMWFAAFLLFTISISLLKKNTSIMHGNVYEKTNNKVGYGKALGKLTLIMSIGMVVCGIVALISPSGAGISNSLVVLVVVMMIAAIVFMKIQKKYSH